MGFSLSGAMSKKILRQVTRGVVRIIATITSPKASDKQPPWPITSLARLGEKRVKKHGFSVSEMRMGYRLTATLFHMNDKAMAHMAEYDIGGGVKVRQYTPTTVKAGEKHPALLYFHGGGFVIGDLETHDTTCRYLAHSAGVAVFAVDYRLAPEHKFPAAFDDAKRALAWLFEHASTMNIDPKRIGVGGDSAGARIALTLGVEGKGKNKPHYLWLVYPAVDMEMDTPSRDKFTQDLFLTKDVMAWFMAQFLPKDVDKNLPVFSPLKSKGLEKLPPTYLMSVGFDPLCDEIGILAQRLKELGRPVTYVHYPQLAHEIFAISGVVPEAKKAIKEATEELRKLAYPK